MPIVQAVLGAGLVAAVFGAGFGAAAVYFLRRENVELRSRLAEFKVKPRLSNTEISAVTDLTAQNVDALRQILDSASVASNALEWLRNAVMVAEARLNDQNRYLGQIRSGEYFVNQAANPRQQPE